MVVIFGRPDAVVAHIEQAAAKHAETVWLPPGAWSCEAEEAARTHHLTLIKDRCIIEAHRHLVGAKGSRALATSRVGVAVTERAEESGRYSTRRR